MAGSDTNSTLFRPVKHNTTGSLTDAVTPCGLPSGARHYGKRIGWGGVLTSNSHERVEKKARKG